VSDAIDYSVHRVTLRLRVSRTAKISAQLPHPAKEHIHGFRVVHGHTTKLNKHEGNPSSKGIRMLPLDMQ
jgi:hypothetical protein